MGSAGAEESEMLTVEGPPPRVSVVVVNWNRASLLLECVRSLLRQEYPDFEVIVVDNGSSDESLPLLRSLGSDLLKIVLLPRNRGFAAGCNAGIAAASGPLVALLNNDAVARRDWIHEMVRAVGSEPGCGMVAGKILFSGTDIIDKAGHLIYWDGQNRGRGTGEKDRGQYDRMEKGLLPDGCAALYRKDALLSAGAFDEDFFAYADDADLGIRIRLLGYECVYTPSAVVEHRHSSTTGSYSLEKIYWVERNRIWLLCKNLPLPLILLSPVSTLWRWLWNGVGLLLGRGPGSNFRSNGSTLRLFWTVVRANLDGWRALPGIWPKRKAIQSRRSLGRLRFWSLLWSFRIPAWKLGLKDRRWSESRE